MKNNRIHFKMTDEDKSILEEKWKDWDLTIWVNSCDALFEQMKTITRQLERSSFIKSKQRLTRQLEKSESLEVNDCEDFATEPAEEKVQLTICSVKNITPAKHDV